MRVTPLAAVLMGLSLTGCQTFALRSPLVVSPAPTICPPSLAAPVPAEPVAPDGVQLADLPPGVAEWWFTDMLPWARPTALRLDQGRRWCAEQSRPPDPG